MTRQSAHIKNIIKRIFPSFLFFLTAVASGAQDSVSSRTYTFKTIAGTVLQLDVFAPLPASAALPAIVLFHGGSWVSGNRSQLHSQCRYFAHRGMIAITADYRLLGKDTARKDICITDARSAVRWVKKHAGELLVDSSRIVLGGASAGAHLATMALLNDDLNDPEDGTVSPVNAVALVLFNPAYNTGGPPSMQPFSFPGEKFPPTIMFFGSRDKWKSAADSLARKLVNTGKTVETWVADGETHGFFNMKPWNLATCALGCNFLISQGIIKNKPEPLTGLLRRQ